MANVGIVLISHSSKVTEGIKEIVSQVINEVPIELAGGTDDNEIGTSVEKIQTAIDRAQAGKGVLLLYDLGSAMMNAELAVELAETDQVMTAKAPLVEGAYVAAVEANMGKSLEEVKSAAELALQDR